MAILTTKPTVPDNLVCILDRSTHNPADNLPKSQILATVGFSAGAANMQEITVFVATADPVAGTFQKLRYSHVFFWF